MGSGRCSRPRPNLVPSTPGAGRQHPTVSGAAVPPPYGWVPRRRLHSPLQMRSRPLSARAEPAPGPRRQHDPRSARAVRSCPCRQQRSTAACATTGVSGRASRHPARPSRTAPGPCCPTRLSARDAQGIELALASTCGCRAANGGRRVVAGRPHTQASSSRGSGRVERDGGGQQSA